MAVDRHDAQPRKQAKDHWGATRPVGCAQASRALETISGSRQTRHEWALDARGKTAEQAVR